MADIQQLIQDLLSSHNERRAAAYAGLLQMKDAALEPLQAALEGQNAALRIEAAHVLTQFADARLIPTFINLTRDSDNQIRYWATVGLGMFKGQVGVADALVEVARHDSEMSNRRFAVQGLYRMGEQATANDIRLHMLNSQNEQELREAMTDLAKAGDKRAIEPIITLLNSKPSNLVFAMALNALGKIGDSQAFDTIVAQLRASEPYRRAVAAQALGELGDQRAIEPLMSLRGDLATAWDEDRGQKNSVGDIASEALRKLGKDTHAGGSQDRPWWKIW